MVLPCAAVHAVLPVVLLVLLTASDASAHRGSVTYLIVEPTGAGANVTADIEIVDAAMELGLGEDAAEDAVLAQTDRIDAFVRVGIWLESESGRCDSTLGPITRASSTDAPRLEIAIAYRCPMPATSLTLHDDTIFAGDAQHETFVRERFGSGTDTRVLRVGRQSTRLGEPASLSSLLGQFAWEGVMHLLTGYDHLLFLLSLLLTTGELAAKRGHRAALRDIAFVVTAFTIGHSITLIIAAMGVLVLPARFVESVIAGSIVVVAVINIVRPEARKQMPWLALGFGLIHGFGFSSVLADLGLPSRARVLSLLSFNVGIEIAQLGCVLLAIGPLEWMARQQGYRTWVVRGGSGCIVVLAGFWMIERALGLG